MKKLSQEDPFCGGPQNGVYNDLISRSALLEAIPDNEVFLSHEVRRLITNSPGVDVIQCKNCEHYGVSPYHHPTIGWCIIHGCHKFPDYFCADADRRVEG